MTQKDIEKRALIFTTFMNGLLTCAGLWVYLTTGIQALFLDFFFSFIALVSTFAAIIISKISNKKTRSFPEGLQFLEPLYSVFKAMLIVTLLIFSVVKTAISTYQYFLTGNGTPLNLTPVLPYTIAMFILCSTISINNTIQNKRISNVSTMLRTEAKINFIDGLQSLIIGFATFLLLLTNINGPFGFLYYTGDFFVTTILVIVTIKQPISEIIEAFREIAGGVSKDKSINGFIGNVISKYLVGAKHSYYIYKKGMFIKPSIIIEEPLNSELYQYLIEKRQKIFHEVKSKYENITIDYKFR